MSRDASSRDHFSTMMSLYGFILSAVRRLYAASICSRNLYTASTSIKLKVNMWEKGRGNKEIGNGGKGRGNRRGEKET